MYKMYSKMPHSLLQLVGFINKSTLYFYCEMPQQMQQWNKINVIIFADLAEDKKLLTEDQVIHICVRKTV